ncbi:tetratricopeptide repeat protein [Herpetosiphon giganteus]|uniref:tetratricopeptide repeat protein n=1 Tax=Herpetosiphon giganteus TaxID=2029754 RepID=UPI00195A7306|nr:tetratricopeptide repeat protein [Herpetosiphon giganteus]MBM7844651.1 tetratricopeptide (TPR) repeat protein [Herpetosiphon giganteus]
MDTNQHSNIAAKPAAAASAWPVANSNSTRWWLIGNIFRLGDRPAKSLPIYQKAINAFRLVNDYQKLSITLGNYAASLRAINRTDEAIEIINEALAYTRANNDLHAMTLNLMYLYDIFQVNKQVDAAGVVLEQAKANIKILRTKYFANWISLAEQQLAALRNQL